MINDTTLKASIMVTTIMEREIIPLPIQIELGLAFDDADPHHQAIAIARTRFFLNEILNKSVFCSRYNPMLAELRTLTNSKILECWDDPWDQFIAIMIYYKVTAILEGSGYVDSVQISGDQLAPDLQYKYHTELFTEQLIEEDSGSLWYHRPDTTINEDGVEDMTWEMLGLTWAPTDDDDPTHYVNNVKKFTPRVIK